MATKQTTKETGDAAEAVASEYYRQLGYTLLARNFRSPQGEIDIVAQKGPELVFVEVKGRGTFREDEAWCPRWRAKKRKLRRIVAIYLARHAHELSGWEETRLDIVYVTQGRVSQRYEDEPFV